MYVEKESERLQEAAELVDDSKERVSSRYNGTYIETMGAHIKPTQLQTRQGPNTFLQGNALGISIKFQGRRHAQE